MTDTRGKIKHAKDKVVGEAKEMIGKITDNEELELKGKIQSSKSDLMGKTGEIKENIAGKINNILDKKDKKRNHK